MLRMGLRVGHVTQGNAFLNWYRFDKVDELKFDDLCEVFDDLWYPSSDDLDILNPNINWVVSIEHFGQLGC
jgi:hypothetical protein